MSSHGGAKRRSRIHYWLPALGWLAAVAFFSSRALGADNTASILTKILGWLHLQVSLPVFLALHYLIRKTAHFTAYGILSALFFRAFRGTDFSPKLWKARYALLALAVCLLTAASDEIHQTFTPGRTGNWHDVVLDMIGAAFVQCMILYGSHTRWAANRWAGRENAGSASSKAPAIVARPAER